MLTDSSSNSDVYNTHIPYNYDGKANSIVAPLNVPNKYHYEQSQFPQMTRQFRKSPFNPRTNHNTIAQVRSEPTTGVNFEFPNNISVLFL